MNLNQITIQAIRDCVRKWRRIARGDALSSGTKSCKLCSLFWHRGCLQCPVRRFTGQTQCHGTPYIRFIRITQNEQHGNLTGRKATNKKQKKVAKQEADFLASLLPKRGSD